MMYKNPDDIWNDIKSSTPRIKIKVMRGFYFLCAALLVAVAANAENHSATVGMAEGAGRTAGNNEQGNQPEKLDSVVVSTSRAGDRTPVTFTMVGKEQLRRTNPINSLPMNLALQPSVVTYNEGGTGLGNSTMTVRGSKGSQINVTLNGITLNDSESQEVFWVNIPSLTGLISSVQLQRGLGTSANGAGAFGASINMSTAAVSDSPFAAADISAGSWNTFLASVAAGTGRTQSGIYFNGAFSYGDTDGYIRNASVNSQSAFAVLGWMNGRNSLRMTYLMGRQKSGITWDGISLEQYETDRRYNGAGEYYDEYGNVHYYDNQTDNYAQHHIQLNYTRQFSDRWLWSNTFNYTRGDGYDEYYKEDKVLWKYGLDEDGESDIIYQKKMGNNYYVFSSDVRYRTAELNLTGGVYLARYEGDHFGNILWVKTLGADYDYAGFNASDGFYRNRSVKQEATVFARGEWSPLKWMTIYADLQWRGIMLDMRGSDDDIYETGLAMKYDNRWGFFNPRAGVTFNWTAGQKAYISAALGHREPGRGDIKENIKGDMSPIKPERMVDMEAGYEFVSSKFSASANIYLMEYWDMLLETGRLSSSGYAIKENVPRGWRRGIEMTAAVEAASWVSLSGNVTLSINKIKDYTSYVAVAGGSGSEGDGGEGVSGEWTGSGEAGSEGVGSWETVNGETGGEMAGEEMAGGVIYQTKAFNYGTTRMMMSPSVVGMVRAAFSPWRGRVSNSLKTTTLAIEGKYVGKQYIDNTQRPEMKIPSYFVANLSLSHEFRLGGGTLGLSFYVNNLFNHLYYAAGWRWEEYDPATGTVSSYVGVYPQPPVNFMAKVSYGF